VTSKNFEEDVKTLLNFPLVILVLTLALLWLAAWVGAIVHNKRHPVTGEAQREDFGLVQGASLTLLGLIIGFSFSMATGRYDQRKNYEEAEANAIGTEYVRADLLPADEASRVKALLREYTAQRIRFYTAGRLEDMDLIRSDTGKMQDQLWAAVAQTANSNPTPIRGLVVSGMNDVLNSEGYTQAAWWNRLPVGAWLLMFAIAVFCNFLVGLGVHKFAPRMLVVLPVMVAVSFFLIADIDSPRGGVIRVLPQNLLRLEAGLK
jgi:hypothetical protein